MIAAQNRFKQDRNPLGGQRSQRSGQRGRGRTAAQNRCKQDRNPLGGSAANAVASVGAS